MSETIHTESRRELAHRSSNGIDVTLYWSPADDGVSVTVVDALGTAFELDVAPQNALDAFHHPYAYALERDVTELLDVAA
jgi:hypothetical protein